MQANSSTFYLGGPACGGYRGYFDEFVREYRTPVLIEGGFSKGAGRILSAVRDALVSRDISVQQIRCASDGQRLDAVGCSSGALCFVNAAEPHAPRALLPSAVERVIPLYDAYDTRLLSERREELTTASHLQTASLRRAERYITAAASLIHESECAVSVCTDLDKAARLAGALSRRYLPDLGKMGKDRVRLLSAMTADGLSFLGGSLDGIETLVVLEDEYGAASDCILRVLRSEALAKGHDIISCPCAVRPNRLEHLILPGFSTAFVTANRNHAEYAGNPRRIHCMRFSSKEGVRARRARIRFNRKTAADLFEQACCALREAQVQQGVIDAIYAQAERSDRMDELIESAVSLAMETEGL